MICARGVLLAASALGFALLGSCTARAQAPDAFGEVIVEFGASGVREVRSAFPDIASVSAPVVARLAEDGSISLAVEETTPAGVVLAAQAGLAGHGVGSVRMVSASDQADTGVQVLPSGTVVVTVRSAAGGAFSPSPHRLPPPHSGLVRPPQCRRLAYSRRKRRARARRRGPASRRSCSWISRSRRSASSGGRWVS